MTRNYQNEEWLRQKYEEEGLTSVEMAELEGVTSKTIRNWMEKYGIERRGQGGHEEPEDSRYRDEEWLRQKYEEELLSVRKIARECDVRKSTIMYWMDKHGIERRDMHWWHEQRQKNKVVGSYKGFIPETGHRYPVTKTHDCDDPLCPARRS